MTLVPGDARTSGRQATILLTLVDAGHATDMIDGPKASPTEANRAGYDVAWFSNPGYPIDPEGF